MKRILYCVLDWGLGHASRSIPIISQLQKQGCEVRIASNGQALDYLKEHFPQITFYNLIGYGASYPTTSLYLNMLSMTFRLQKAMRKETEQINDIVSEFVPEIIISDNRYGCHHPSALNIFLSHQLRLPATNALEQKIGDQFLNNKLKPFAELWVPDNSPPNHLTGCMSEFFDERVKYIGPLSSMSSTDGVVKKNRILILLSGPEPARTKLENKLLTIGLTSSFECQLIRGTKRKLQGSANHFQITDVANGEEVSHAIAVAEYVICRSGYSTIMDLQKLNKNAIFIPTPGQPEQVYLADVVSKKNYGVMVKESKLSLELLKMAMRRIDHLVATNEQSNAQVDQHILRVLN